jgi:hypothetical protein
MDELWRTVSGSILYIMQFRAELGEAEATRFAIAGVARQDAGRSGSRASPVYSVARFDEAGMDLVPG